MERRKFLVKAAAAAAGSTVLLSSCGKDEQNKSAAVINRKTYEWKMVTTWSPHFPVLGEGADELAKTIEIMSEGRIKIQVYGGGELVPALETFDAVSQGLAEMGHSASYYWAGKAPAAQFFTSVPFGMSSEDTYSWFFDGGGLGLWNEVYAPFNVVVFPAGNTGSQMGGWFNKEIKSLADLKGLKIRLPGIGGKIISKAGATSILSPGGEIYTNLERGVIDATDWIGPYHDYLMGFHKIAKYYYHPSWSERTGVVELILNKSAYEDLPNDLQEIIKSAALAANQKMLSKIDTLNFEYYEKLKNEGKVQFKKFPPDVLEAFKKYSDEVIAEITTSDPLSKKVYDSYSAYMAKMETWNKVTSL